MFLSKKKIVPMFSVSTPDLVDTHMSAFPTEYSLRGAVARVESREPLAVASCPATPETKRRATSMLRPLRKFITKHTATPMRKSSSRRNNNNAFLTAPRSPLLPSPSSPRRTTVSAGNTPSFRSHTQRGLTILDAGFFLTGESGLSDDDRDAMDADCASEDSGSARRMPVNPFATPPCSPARGALFVIGNSPTRLSGSPRRRKQQMKIVQKLGIEAASAAEECTRLGEVFTKFSGRGERVRRHGSEDGIGKGIRSVVL
ncbi:hypothetical protein C8R47DRAFT_1158532 [Mycena vitilis]|nr:hypothetical protein C8R47DRAFT_1158532 [Mycena vitilis]